MDEASAVSYIKVEIRSASGVANSQARDDQAGAGLTVACSLSLCLS